TRLCSLLRQFILDRLELGAHAVAQRGKPGFSHCAASRIGRERKLLFGHGSGKDPICRNASASAIAPASATFNERAPGRNGMTTRAATARCTASGTPALSRPRRIVSSAANAKRCNGTVPVVVIKIKRDLQSRSARKVGHETWRQRTRSAA